MSEREVSLYLYDILEAIADTEEFVRGMSFTDFQQDKKTQKAVVRNLEIIGEAVNHVYEEAIQHRDAPESNVPWKSIVDMRNQLIHEYFGTDLQIVWDTIQEDLPLLKTEVENLLARYQTSDE